MRAINRLAVGTALGLSVLFAPAAMAEPANFFTLTPCRVFDTLGPDAPPLADGVPRTIQISGPECGVPLNASSVHFNMTVLNSTADGDLVLYSADEATPAPPRPGSLPFKAGKTKAKSGVVSLSAAGAINALATMTAGATVDVILDITGYFVDDQGPVAVDDTATVAEDSAATTIDVQANDTDVDGGTNTIISVQNPSAQGGTVLITNAGADLTYQPAANYCNTPPGTTLDTFTYTLSPGGDVGTVTVTVTCVEDDPTAVDDSATVAEDAPATTIDVLLNDTDPDGGAKTIASATDPANGTVVVAGDNLSLTYQPDANYCNDPSGTPDTFDYTLSPGGSTATVSVTVTCAGDDPTAVDDSATVAEDAAATTIDVLANDTDPDGGPKTIATATDPANGTVVIAGDNLSLTYQPDPNYCNTPPGTTLDTFSYTLAPGGDTGVVSVTVTCVDDNPTAVADSATVAEDSGATTINVLANDTDPDGGTKTIASATDPANGTVVVAGDNLSLTYQPDPNYCNNPPGTTLDTFNYTLNPGGSSTTVSVTVTCVDDNPVAVADSATVAEDAAATTIDVLANDTDSDGGPKTIASATDPANGTVVVAGDNLSLTYQPDPNYCNAPPGTTLDTFNYTLNGGSSTTVSVTVTCVDDNPTAVADSATVNEDAPATTINVLANDTDPDGGTKTIASATDPANGTVVVAGDNLSLTYQPDPNYCNNPPGTTLDTFNYTLSPGGSSTTVSVTVTCIDDPPVAVNDAATVLEDSGANAIDVLANDTDIDAGPKTVNAVQNPSTAGGTVLITGGGLGVSYNPAPNYCNNPPGTTLDTFTYTLNGGSIATVTVTVTCVNDAPVPVADAFQAIGNTELRVDMVAGTTPHTPETTPGASSYEGVLDNDGDPEGDTVAVTAVLSGCSDASAPFDCTLTSGAVVHVDANGEFSFTPGPGDTSDSFQYTITDTPGFGTPQSANGTVTLTHLEMVWYVNNGGAAGNGTSIAPFNAITGTNIGDTSGDTDLTDDLDDASDYLFVYFGNGTDSGQNTGLQLEASQHLLGEFAGLSIPVNVNGNGSPTVLVAPPSPTACTGGVPCRPQLSNTAGNAVTASDDNGAVAPAIGTIPVEIVGMSLQGSANAIDLTTNAALSGSSSLTILQNVFRGAGAEGIDANLDAGTAGTLTLNVQTNSWNTSGTHTGNAVDINRAAGTLLLDFSNNANLLSAATAVNISGGAAASTTITSFANNTVHQNTGGSGILVSNATFDGTPTGSYQQVSGGTTVIGISGNGVGGAGMSLSGIAGDLGFTDLDIFADGGAGLAITGTAVVNTGAGTGTRVTVGSGVGIVEATGGPALSLSTMTADFQLTSLKSTNSSSTGVSLTNVGDGTTVSTISAGSSSTITNATGTDFSISGGNATVTYNGTITDDIGQLVSVGSATGDTISFTGAITDGDDGDGSGVSLTSNTGATISFSGGLVLATGANAAFTATGGGTLVVCDENPCGVSGSNGGLINKITTTTAAALNVANTTIGANNLEFRSISAGTAASGPTNGISLNTTGASGGLKVKGTGSAGTGGTIQRATGPGVLLMTAAHTSLSWMNVQNGTDDGIHGETVNNLDLLNCSVTGNGNSTTDDGLQLGLESGTTIGITGTLNITNTSISSSAHNNVHIRNDNTAALATLTAMNVTGSTFNNLNDTFGANSFLFEASGSSAVTAATISSSNFVANSPQRGLEVQAHGTATITMFTVSGNNFSDNGIHASFTQDTSSNLTFHMQNNLNMLQPLGNTALQAINVFSSSTSTGGTLRGLIQGNTIGNAGTNGSGSGAGNGIRVLIQGRTVGTLQIDGNTIRQVGFSSGSRGIDMQFLGPTAAAQPITVSDITITNNFVQTDAPAGTFPLAAIFLGADDQGSPARVRADIRGNTVPAGGSFDYPGFSGTDGQLVFVEVGGAAEGQLVDNAPASGTAQAELVSHNTGNMFAAAGVALIAGPINTPP